MCFISASILCDVLMLYLNGHVTEDLTVNFLIHKRHMKKSLNLRKK